MNKEKQFWNWFKNNNSRFFYLNQIVDTNKKEELLDEFLQHLHIFSDKLYFEIGGYPNETRKELIISAEGNKEYFPCVERLIAFAPSMQDWEIIAFKPPMGIDFVTEYEDIKLDPKAIWFLPLDNEDDPLALGIRMCVPNYTLDKADVFLAGAYQVLHALLGEKSAALDISYVEVDKLPKTPEKEGLIELVQLREYINWRRTKH